MLIDIPMPDGDGRWVTEQIDSAAVLAAMAARTAADSPVVERR
ncbi:hypothetical protein [Cryobacterium sp. MLB-32]|nr:hypothetical protein [Cryobacterium sp. MLB-32]